MFSNKLLNISEFAKISGVSRQTLIYYDRIGLFSPIMVADNKYRLYSHNQVDNIGIITILSDLGIPLKKIKEILADISLDTISNTLEYQLTAIQEKIEKLSLLRDMTELRLEQLNEGRRFCDNLENVHIEELKEDISICIGNSIQCLQEDIGDDVVLDFFDKIEKLDIPMIFSFGHIKCSEDILQGVYNRATNMWFRLKDKKHSNDIIPSGKYIVGYGRGDYGNTNYIYPELLKYAEEHQITLTGRVYEEYLIDELSEKDPNNFVVKVIVAIL